MRMAHTVFSPVPTESASLADEKSWENFWGYR